MAIEFEILVVDNASRDGSKEIILKQFPNIIWIQNEINEGFGRANNIGINASKGSYIALLNTDTLVIENTVEKALLKFKKEQENTGMVTCQLINADQTLQKSVFYYNSSFYQLIGENLLIDYLRSKKRNSKKIQALHGAFLLFNKKRISNIGFFDPDFFLYAEEFEWCYRILKHGMKLKIYDEFRIIHHEEKSSISKEWNTKQRYLSNALLFKKNHGTLGLLLYLMISFFNLLTNIILMWKLDSKFRKDFLKRQKYFWSLFPIYILVLLGIHKNPLQFQ
jgi:GT2 family glycosyltransferase